MKYIGYECKNEGIAWNYRVWVSKWGWYVEYIGYAANDENTVLNI